ncbi:retrovirus-related pol polyprotein from transposon TNT 1-94 [Tanacetum coccineum]
MEETLSKFMSESAKRHEENSNLIKEIRASTDAAIRNQGASIKTLEIQIGQMSKVLQERGFGSLPSSTETNPRDHVKSISTIVEADSYPIRRMGSSQYAVSTGQNRTLMYETKQTTILFPSRLNGYYCEEKKGSYGPMITTTYSQEKVKIIIESLVKKKQKGAILELKRRHLKKVSNFINTSWCMTRSSTKELLSPLENLERVLHSRRKLFNNPSLVETSSPESKQLSEIKEHIKEEEVTEIMAETMEQYMSKTRENYGSGITRPTINQDTPFELKGQFLKELHNNTFSASEHEDANEHIEKVLKIVDLFHIPKEVILFYNGIDVPTQQILDSKGAIPLKTTIDAKITNQEMAKYSQKWHNGTSSRIRSTETSDRLAAIQAQLNNLGREIKKVNEKVYAAQVGCKQCKGPHYTKDCPQKEEGKILEEACYTQFGTPYQPGGQYRGAGPGFYQRNNGNSSYPAQRETMEESLAKFMTESAKRHEKNSNIIKEIRASTDAAIQNQGALIKTLELQIRQMTDLSEIRRDYTTTAVDAYDNTLPQKEKDPGSFTLPCLINNICFDKALVDIGASVSVMPLSTYTNHGLG